MLSNMSNNSNRIDAIITDNEPDEHVGLMSGPPDEKLPSDQIQVSKVVDNIYVGNLPNDTTKEELQQFFTENFKTTKFEGSITFSQNTKKLHAILRFHRSEEINKAVCLNGHILRNHVLVICKDCDRRKQKADHFRKKNPGKK